MFGRIKIGRPTAGHEAWLKSKGYNVRVEGDHLVVEAPGGFITDAVDLGTSKETAIAALKAIVEKKALVTYQTPIIFPASDGQERKPLFGFVAAARLGAASALMAKIAKGDAKKAETGFTF